MVLTLYSEFSDASDRVKAWEERTGKRKSAFYRRQYELKEKGLIAGA